MPSRGSKSRLSPAEATAWQGLLRLNARLLKELDADLVREHRMPHSSYDVMIQLAVAPESRLRMSELAQEVLMSPSGLTRIVDALEREGLVARERRSDDARSFDAVLTTAGRDRLRAANVTHLERVRELFLDRLSDAQLAQLAEIWATLGPELTASPAARRRAANASANAGAGAREDEVRGS